MSVKKISGKTGKGLVEYAKAQVGLPYWCGTFGQIATQWLYEYNKSRLPMYYTANDFQSQFGKKVHDCVGLIKGYMWCDTPTSSPIYNPSQDVTVEKMYSLSDNHGSISNMVYEDGILVFNSSLSHVGVYSDGYVYQAAGHAYGVTKNVFDKNAWSYWAECPYIEYDVKEKDDNYLIDTRTLPEIYYGKMGKTVEVWQDIVDVTVDGVFGIQTKQATIKFQKVWFPNDATEWDGIVGAKTWAKGLKSLK